MKYLAVIAAGAMLIPMTAQAGGVQRPVSLYTSGGPSNNVPAPHRFTPAETELLQDPSRRPANGKAASFSES